MKHRSRRLAMETLGSRELLTSLTGEAAEPAKANFVGMDSFIYTVVDDGTTVGTNDNHEESYSAARGDSDSTACAANQLWGDWFIIQDDAAEPIERAEDSFRYTIADNLGQPYKQFHFQVNWSGDSSAQAVDAVFAQTEESGERSADSNESAWRSISHGGIR